MSRYDTLIVDEAHERSLNIDFVLGILKSLLPRRRDLKVLITSATIDTKKFSEAFGQAPIIEVSGRMYPVETRYADDPITEDESEELSFIERAVRVMEELQRKNPFGDVLIFMPTEQAIRETVDAIAARGYKGVTVLPLFARLTASEQKKVFRPVAGRKVIVATNIAETSITIPGIKYVIDTGLARISRYSPRSRTTGLPVIPISRSSADQRQGRCGRVADGVCIRLFSEEDYLSRPLFTPPEILRANLAEVILRMIGLRLGRIADFPFIDRPAAKSIRDGFDLLLELGAIVRQKAKKKKHSPETYELTRMGKMMARMPLDPRLSRILIEAEKEGCVDELLIIASALSIQDPRERPVEKSDQADRIHAGFQDPLSDFITLLNIWEKFQAVLKTRQSTGGARRFCREHFLSFNRLREWIDIHEQIRTALKEYRPAPKSAAKTIKPGRPASAPVRKREKFGLRYTAIHRSILSGFLANIAVKKEKNIFRTPKGREAMIFPGSGLFGRAGEWIVAGELVETSRLFIRTAANIDNAWLEHLGQSFCRYTYLEPRWDKGRGEVVATEQVRLFGLIIVPGRPVGYGPIRAAEAADIFIREALIAGDLKRPPPFVAHNLNLIDKVREMENRIRKRTLMVDEEVLFDFYRRRLPLIFDVRTLETYIKENGGDGFLRMKESDLFANSPDESELSLYPDVLQVDGREYPFRYKFEPGASDDGVTVEISSTLSGSVPAERLDWLVPGLLKEKIIALIKGLPKKYRTRLVPANTVADVIAAKMPRQNIPLTIALSRFVFEQFGFSIPPRAWPLDRLPDHLKMRIALTGPQGEILAAGRDSSLLTRKSTRPIGRREFEAAKQKWERNGIIRWDFGDLPDSISLGGEDGSLWICHVALAAEKETAGRAGLRLFEQAEEAAAAHPAGVAQLFGNRFSKELKFLKKELHLPLAQKRLGDYFGGSGEVEKRLLTRIKKDLFHKNIRTEKAFKAQTAVIEAQLMEYGRNMLSSVSGVLEALHEARRTFCQLENANRDRQNCLAFLSSLRKELARLVPQNFLELYSCDRMIHLDRYISAVSVRAQRGCLDLEKDQQRAGKLLVYRQQLDALLNELSPLTSPEKRKALEDFFWLLEEYKVSLFAQELKTVVPVSAKRLDQTLSKLDKMI